MNGLDFCQPLPPSTPTKKTSIFATGATFLGFFGPPQPSGLLKKKIRLCHFSYLMTMQLNVVLCSSVSEKTNKPFMRSNVTNGRSDEHSQICKTLSLKLSNNYNYTMVIQ